MKANRGEHSRTYDTDADGHRLYPEQLAVSWQPLRSNPHRAIDTNLTANWGPWHDGHAVSMRSGITLGTEPLPKHLLLAVVANATSREDFHDYNWQMSAAGGWGSCLCEIRIVTGGRCMKYLRKGEDEAVRNLHWAWQLDVAPRGKVCPLALKKRYEYKNEQSKWPCREILLLDKLGRKDEGIDRDWVLAMTPNSPDDAIPGRAISDIVISGECVNCRYLAEERKAGRNPDPRGIMTRFNEIPDPVMVDKMNASEWEERPIRYRPVNHHQTGHPTLVDGDYYYRERLTRLGVLEADREYTFGNEWERRE
jgi:hypothetical protein